MSPPQRPPTAPRRLLHTVVALCSAAIVAVLGYSAYSGYEQQIELAERETRSLSTVLSRQVRGSIGAIDVILRDVAAEVERAGPDIGTGPDSPLSDYMRRHVADAGGIRSIFVVGLDGRVRHHTIRESPPLDVSDRAYFTAHLGDAGAPGLAASGLHVGEPLVSRLAGSTFLSFSRAVLDGDGRVRGVVVATVDTAHLERFYATIDLFSDYSIALWRHDSVLLAHWPSQPELLGADRSDAADFAALLAPGLSGSATLSDPVGTGARVLGYAASTGLPLSVVVGRERAHALAPWREKVWRESLLGLALLLCIGGLVVVAERHFRHRTANEAELRHAYAVIERSAAVLYRLGPEDGWPILYVSPNVRRFGFEPGDLVGQPGATLVHPNDLRRVATEVAGQIMAGATEYKQRYRMRTGDGSVRWVEDMSQIWYGPDGMPERLEGVLVDVTEKQEAENALQASEDRMRRAVMEAPSPIIQHAEDGEMLLVNREWVRMTGWDISDIPTIAAWTEKAYGGGERAAEVARGILDLHHRPGDTHDRGEFRIRTATGEERIWRFRSLSIGTLPDGRKLMHSVVTDVTEQKQTEERLRSMALHDVLTGLPNRTFFFEQVRRAMAQMRRTGEKFAVMMLDLDHFKDVNDSLGHAAGDRLLQQVARRLEAAVRETDTVSRLGGDEFAILQTGVNDTNDVTVLVEKLTAAVAEPVTIRGNPIVTNISVGISLPQSDADEAEKLVERADQALYTAKREGRNTHIFHTTELGKQTLRDIRMARALREALTGDQLSMAFQPQYEIGSGRIVGAEALVRWKLRGRNIPPAAFIRIAESHGMITELGERMLTGVARQMRRWLDMGVAPRSVAVNLSVTQLRQDGFADNVLETLRDHRVPPERFELEFTETTLLDDQRRVRGNLDALEAAGVLFSIDDFGTGYSSLIHLRALPIHRLKIAQEFVLDMIEDRENYEIVKATIALAHALDLETLAEGVETYAHRKVLADLGCDIAQGYYYSKPLHAEEMTVLLSAASAGEKEVEAAQ